MKNVIREKIGKRDIMNFANNVETDLFEATGDNLAVITKAVGYPLRIAQAQTPDGTLKPIIPAIDGIYAKPDLIDPKEKPEIKNKHMEILSENKTSVGCSLTYNYKTYYYRDPNNSDQIDEIRIPAVDYTSLPDFFDFCIKYFESIEDFRKYIYIILATNPNIVNQKWPGTGWELFEKLIGSTVSLGTTRADIAERTNKSPSELSTYLEGLESEKKVALVELSYIAYHNHKFIKGLKGVKKALQATAADHTLTNGENLITDIQVSPLTPIETERQSVSFTPINGTPLESKKMMNKLF